jgi:hypothetical protein
VVVAALLLAATQPAAANLPEVPTCSLVTPRGDAIGFFIWSGEAPNEIRLSATSGSVWPAGTVVGSRGDQNSNMRFTIGERRGFVLELSAQAAGRAQRSATLFLRDGNRAALPMAYGFCDERPAPEGAQEPNPDRNLVGMDHPALNPALWPEDCGLILSDGRRLRFDYTLIGSDRLRLEGRELWSGRPLTTRFRRVSMPRGQVGSFGQQGGPEGLEMFFVEPPRGAKLVRFQQLGDPSLPNLTGYGICGYKAVVRRPNR